MIRQSPQRKVFDCVLYNGELDVLCIRLNELWDVVDHFVVVESDTTFSGLPKTICYDHREPRIAPFAQKIRHVVVADMPKTDDPWEREKWQRNAVLRGLADADPSDLILMSDVDEIPRACTVRDMTQNTQDHIFGLRLAFYYFFLNYRNVEGPESSITWTVAATRNQLEKITPDDLRYAVRKGEIKACILSDAGWHFSWLTDDEGARRKIAAFSHQEFNDEVFLSSIDILGLVQRREDMFGRPGFCWAVVDPCELPAWVQANRESIARLFVP